MANQTPDPKLKTEPSVLDYFLAKIMPWRGPAPEIPPLPEGDQQTSFENAVFVEEEVSGEYGSVSIPIAIPWRVMGAILFALVGQFMLLPPLRQAALGVGFFLSAFGLALWAVLLGELNLALPKEHTHPADRFEFALVPLLAGLGISLVAFLAFGGNQYTQLNVALWLVGLALIVWAFLFPRPDFAAVFKRGAGLFQRENWQINISRNTVLLAAALAVGIFFRVYRVGGVVPEMFSDQAEKLLDVYDVLQGTTRIFFPRNTGREGLQFYLIAATIKLFDTGISFLSMKIGTIFMGIFMLPYMYLLGKELGSKQVGLAAVFFTGISFWLNVLARVALRFILYPAFAAPTLYYLIRGLRTGKRNYFIAAALFLGVGLHGYTPFRAVPILIVVVCLLYWLHNRRQDTFYKTVIWLSLVTLVSLIVFLPLLRVWFEDPAMFNFRTMTRMTALERGDEMAQGLALLGVFASNVWRATLMYNWNSGSTWVNTIPGYPSLDLVTGAFFLLGVGLVLVRYIRKRRWEDSFLLLAVPILMLPTTLSLAFPAENPAPNRAGGASVVVYILAALAFEALIRAVRQGGAGKLGYRMAFVLALVLAVFAVGHNYNMTFDQFPSQYRPSVWNTSELGAVMEQFTDTVGSSDQAWVVAYPHWVDTRLVGINAGFPIKDFAIAPEDLETTLLIPSPKLFLIKLEDQAALDILATLYPTGESSLYNAAVPTQSFHIFYVP